MKTEDATKEACAIVRLLIEKGQVAAATTDDGKPSVDEIIRITLEIAKALSMERMPVKVPVQGKS